MRRFEWKWLYALVITEGSLVFGMPPYVAAILNERSGIGSAFAGMVIGSLAPQWISNQKTDVEPFVPDTPVRAAAGR